MSTQESRPAIDIDPPATTRPTIALVLALLAVPGSTVAWDLPLGGLWIGLPLALAAIVLAVRARREGTGTGRATAAIVIAGLCIAQMAVWSVASAVGSTQAPAGAATLTFKELDEGARFTHVRNSDGPRRANLQGDIFASVAPLADNSDERIGRLHMSCVTTKGARNYLRSQMTCTGIADLADGTLTAQFADAIDETTTGAVTGGTGAYANARGTFVSEATEYGALTTVTFDE